MTHLQAFLLYILATLSITILLVAFHVWAGG